MSNAVSPLLIPPSRHEKYDPEAAMTLVRQHSPGYHTTLPEGGWVHPTRESLQYVVELLDTHDSQWLGRATAVIERVLGLQDTDPSSRTYGIWSWFLEEPLAKMSPPDWNWADFCGRELLQVKLRHAARMPDATMQRIDQAILHAAESIRRRNVRPGYTNICALGGYVTLVAGEQLRREDFKMYGLDRLTGLLDHVRHQGGFSEYNSPPYAMVTLHAFSETIRDSTDLRARTVAGDLMRLVWEEIAEHYHSPTRQWAGPHSRAYHTLLRPSTLELIERSTAESPATIAGAVAPTPCPDDLRPRFGPLAEPRQLRKVWVRATEDQPGIAGTTYLHPDFALGSINRGDLWNQRRPLLLYAANASAPAYLRVRFLHDGYDFSAAQIYCAQQAGHVIAAINFATDGGDRHVSLDRMTDGVFTARDLRLRFELGGSARDLKPDLPSIVSNPVLVRIGEMPIRIEVPHARFGELTGSWRYTPADPRADEPTGGLDVVFHQGLPRGFRLADMPEAALALGVIIGDGEAPNMTVEKAGERLSIRQGTLSLSTAARPAPLQALHASTRDDSPRK